MGWLALAVACSLTIATIFKFGENAGLDRIALLAVNYLVAFALAALLSGGQIPTGPAALSLLGATMGILYISGFVAFALAIREAGMALAVSTMRLSVAIPVLVGWLVWAEAPTRVQLIGLLLAAAAFLLIARSSKAPASNVAGLIPAGSTADVGRRTDTSSLSATRVALVLAALFVAGGAVDVLLKAYNETFGPDYNRAGFLTLAFGMAFLLGGGYVVTKGVTGRGWPSRRAVQLGAFLGVVNYGSADFMLRAIAVLPAPVVFPANNLAVVLGAAAIGVFIWGESLSKSNLIGLMLAALALLLLTL